MASVTLRAAQKRFGQITVIPGIDLQVEAGEFVVFVGPSGCGKSTLLRMIAGLEDITAGSLEIDGKPMQDVAAAKRGVAMVFQSYALYPHMTVRKNISFALETQGVSSEEISAKVAAVADMLRITPLLDRKPAALSGGQRQRVAMGRAMVRQPKVFLFDEPLSNLDADLRAEMRGEIARLHREYGTTIIYVTHDQTEAMTLADRIVVLNKGEIAQIGSPRALYDHPANKFVAGFIGTPRMNFLPAAALGNLPPDVAEIGVRPEAIRCCYPKDCLAGVVDQIEDLGHERLVHLLLATGQRWVVRVDMVAAVPALGEPLGLRWDIKDQYHFDSSGTNLNMNGSAP